MIEQKNIRIIFTEKADAVLSNIMEKYNLEENEEESFKKLSEGKVSRIVIIDKLTKDFVGEKISKKELTTSLQRDLEVPQKTAEEISEDIINNLAPLLEKISEEQLKKPFSEEQFSPKIAEEIENSNVFTKIKMPIEVDKILAEKQPIKKATERIKKSLKMEEIPKTITREPKKQDSYREPID